MRWLKELRKKIPTPSGAFVNMSYYKFCGLDSNVVVRAVTEKLAFETACFFKDRCGDVNTGIAPIISKKCVKNIAGGLLLTGKDDVYGEPIFQAQKINKPIRKAIKTYAKAQNKQPKPA